MSSENEPIRLSLTISPELNARLDELAAASYSTKSEILRKAIALFDVVSEAKAEKKRFGILDQNKKLLTEIIGL